MHVFLTSDSPVGETIVRDSLVSIGHTVAGPTVFGAGALLNVEEAHVGAMVAVLWSSRASRKWSAVLVEIGVALGHGIPVLLVTKPGVPIPALQGLPRVLVGDGRDELLAVQIDLFLRGVEKGDLKERKRASSSGPAHPRPPVNVDGLRMEDAIARLLQAAGPELMSSPPSTGDRADFTLYFPLPESDIGIVLVEVKEWKTVAPVSGLRQAAARLSEQVSRSGAGVGLLIYNGPPVRFLGAPLVAAVTFEDFTRQLAQRPLVDVLRRARNEAIHGR